MSYAITWRKYEWMFTQTSLEHFEGLIIKLLLVGCEDSGRWRGETAPLSQTALSHGRPAHLGHQQLLSFPPAHFSTSNPI